MLKSPLDCKEIQPVHPEGDQSWVFIGRTDAEAETPILWPPHVKSWLIGKDPDAWRDWGQEEKGTTGWDGWMASPTLWAWVWVNSGTLWWTGRPSVLRFMGSQRVGHDRATELTDWLTDIVIVIKKLWKSPDLANIRCLLLLAIHLLETPYTITHPASLSVKFFRQVCWSRLPLPTLGDLLDPGIEFTFLVSPALADTFFATVPLLTSMLPLLTFLLDLHLCLSKEHPSASPTLTARDRSFGRAWSP